jgi:hypothetical protein
VVKIKYRRAHHQDVIPVPCPPFLPSFPPLVLETPAADSLLSRFTPACPEVARGDRTGASFRLWRPSLPISTDAKKLSISNLPAPFLTGSDTQTECDVTSSKQRTGRFLTGARTHIRIFEILQISAQNDDATSIVPSARLIPSEAVVGPTRNLLCFLFVNFRAFLTETDPHSETAVTHSKQTTATFLPGARTALKQSGSRDTSAQRQNSPRLRVQLSQAISTH